MIKRVKYSIAVFFTIILIGLISAPVIISCLDDSVDITGFYGINEEEENETVKLVFDNFFGEEKEYSNPISKDIFISYTFKDYSRPHLNLISPPPELQFA